MIEGGAKITVIDRNFGFGICQNWGFPGNFGLGQNRGFGWPKVNRNDCNKLSRILMDLGKLEPVFGGANSILTKFWVRFLPKQTFQRVSLVTPKIHEL